VFNSVPERGKAPVCSLLLPRTLQSWDSFSLRHLGHLSRDSIKTRCNSIDEPIFSDVMTGMT